MVSKCVLLCLSLLSGGLCETNTELSVWSSNSTASTYWSDKVAALQSQIEARMEARKNKRPMLRGAASTTSVPPESTLMTKIVDLQRKMCADPARKDRASCKQFAGKLQQTTTAEPSAHRAALVARGEVLKTKMTALKEKQADWDRDMAAQAKALGQELCMEPSRKGYEACKPFLQASSVSATAKPQANSVGRPASRLAIEIPHQQWGRSVASENQEPATTTEPQEVTPWVFAALRVMQLLFNVCVVCLALLWCQSQQKNKQKEEPRLLLQC